MPSYSHNEKDLKCLQPHHDCFEDLIIQFGVVALDVCWGPSASEGPQKQDLTLFLEYNV
jgi:hypothetical protein